MAARKSCTKMTWSEAKNKCGVGGSKNPNKSTNKLSQHPDHGKMLAAKLISKSGPSENERIKNRQAAKTAKKDQIRQQELDQRRELQKEQRKLDEMVKTHEMAIQKRKELEDKFHKKLSSDCAESQSEGSNSDNDDSDRRNLICESKQLQLDEILALEAIYGDTDLLRVSATSQQEALQEKIDEWQSDPDTTSLQTAITEHPALSYTLKRSIDDPENDDRVAHMLLHVLYPEDYPLETTPPTITVIWCMVTKKSLLVSSNKPLESLADLDESGLFEALSKEAQEFLLGMPGVYELLDSWLGEHLFEFLQDRSSR